jgi:hypothetical protein
LCAPINTADTPNDLYGLAGGAALFAALPARTVWTRAFMGTATIQVRVLAVAGLRVWVAVSGTLCAATLRVLHYSLCARATEERTHFYIDLNDVHHDDALPAAELPQLLPSGRRLRFHIVGAHESFRSPLGADARCRFHSDVASAWAAWSRAS